MYNEELQYYCCGQCGNGWFGPRVDSIMTHWVICPHCGHMFETY